MFEGPSSSGQSALVVDYSWFWDENETPLPDESIEVDLVEGDRESARKFWGVILMLGGRDHAESVQFRHDSGDECLSMRVEGIDYAMMAPPEELREWLLRFARDLIAGSRWRGILWGWKARVLKRVSSRSLVLAYWGHQIYWTGAFGPKGVSFYRNAAADADDAE